MDEEIRNKVAEHAQAEELNQFYRGTGSEEKGIDNFFIEIVKAEDTKKIGNLTEDELGIPQLPVRTLLELKEDCELIPSMSSFANSFKNTAEAILSTSLSKEGFLIRSRITQKRELGDKPKKKKKGLFSKKEGEE